MPKEMVNHYDILHAGNVANFLVCNNDHADRAKIPLGSDKFMPLPSLKFFNKDILSSRGCLLDSYISSSDLYHMQRKEPHVLQNFMIPFLTTKL